MGLGVVVVVGLDGGCTSGDSIGLGVLDGSAVGALLGGSDWPMEGPIEGNEVGNSNSGIIDSLSRPACTKGTPVVISRSIIERSTVSHSL